MTTDKNALHENLENIATQQHNNKNKTSNQRRNSLSKNLPMTKQFKLDFILGLVRTIIAQMLPTSPSTTRILRITPLRATFRASMLSSTCIYIQFFNDFLNTLFLRLCLLLLQSQHNLQCKTSVVISKNKKARLKTLSVSKTTSKRLGNKKP